MTYLTLLAQAAPVAGNGPLFTNDMIGFLKALGIVIVPAVSAVATVWAMLHGPMQRQLNGLGKRLNDVSDTQAGHDARLTGLHERANRVDMQMENVQTAQARTERAVDEVARGQLAIKTEILNEFARFGEIIRKSVHEVDKSVVGVKAALDERARVEERR